MENNQVNKQIFATFILRGNGLNPHEVTEYLGITPSKYFKRGELRDETERWNRNFWGLTSQDKIDSPDLSTHIAWILDQFEPVKDRLIEMIHRNEVQGEISCFWIFPTNHEVLMIKPDIVRRISDLGIRLNIDMYCPHD